MSNDNAILCKLCVITRHMTSYESRKLLCCSFSVERIIIILFWEKVQKFCITWQTKQGFKILYATLGAEGDKERGVVSR